MDAASACKPACTCLHFSGPASTAPVMMRFAMAIRLLNNRPRLASIAAAVVSTSMVAGMSTAGLCIRQSHDIFFYLCFYLHLFNVIKFFFFDSWGFR